MRSPRAWRRYLTAWLACQLLATSLASLAVARPLWDSFLSVLAGPACVAPDGDGEAPAPHHTPLCILCAALGGPALAELPAQPLAPAPRLSAEAVAWSVAAATGSARPPAAQGCRGPPAAA